MATKLTVKMAVLQAYNMLPGEFGILRLCEGTRDLMARPLLMDSTITASLRKLRIDGYIDYTCTDNKKGKYKKNFEPVQGKLKL